ncbi:MAG: hypothetical protein ABI569_01545 [Casimicrobiaceae bacterium]
MVDNLPDLIEALLDAGYEVKYDGEPVAGIERAITLDPFGNRIELVQPNPAKHAPLTTRSQLPRRVR